MNFAGRFLILACGLALLSSCTGIQLDMPIATLRTTANTESHKTDIVTQTSLPAATRTPTFTPLPTLELAAAREKVDSLLQNNGGCELPCWWGITPGQSPWPETKNLLDSLADLTFRKTYSLKKRVYLYSFPTLDPFPFVEQNYYVLDGKLALIESYLPFNHSTLAGLLLEFGAPTQVLIKTRSRSREFSLPYRIVLYFPETGILARLGEQAVEEGENIKICPQERDIGFLMLWSPDREMELDELLGPDYGYGDPEGLMPLLDVSEWDEEIFHENFSNPETNSCIVTPKIHWPP